jgi:hypothetical protein
MHRLAWCVTDFLGIFIILGNQDGQTGFISSASLYFVGERQEAEGFRIKN